jgi:hypothetical protein
MLCFLLIQCLLFWLRVSCSAVTLSTSVFETIFISSTFLRNFVTASTLTGTSIPLSFTLEHLWVSHWNTFEFHIGTPLSFTLNSKVFQCETQRCSDVKLKGVPMWNSKVFQCETQRCSNVKLKGIDVPVNVEAVTKLRRKVALEHLWVSHWNTFEFHIGTPLRFTFISVYLPSAHSTIIMLLFVLKKCLNVMLVYFSLIITA